MSKKRFDTQAITNELQQSRFFAPKKTEKKLKTSITKVTKDRKQNNDVVTPRRRGVTTSHKPLDHFEPDIAKVAKQLLQFGKERTSLRMTEDEKNAVSQLIFNLRGQGIKITENDIFRLSLLYLIEEYEYNSGSSIIEKIIKQRDVTTS